jgi:hypothetical protein
MKRYAYTFASAKATLPNSERVLLALYEIEYAINAITGRPGYLLFYNLTVQDMRTNGIEIGIEFIQPIISNLKISMLVISNEFLYNDIFTIETYERFRLPNGTINREHTMNPAKTPYHYFPFLTSANI